MSLWATAASICFVLLAMALSSWKKLGLERDLFIGMIRATVQLIAVGYVLSFVFSRDHWLFIVLMIVIMVLVATRNAASRGKGIPRVSLYIGLTITTVTAVTIGLMLVLHTIEPKPQALIPISGMVIGSCMTTCSLLLNQMRQRVQSMRDYILVALSLGATSRQAGIGLLRESVRAGMIPTIDVLKTVGLVQLPGMMTGFILAGASPIEAVRYQLLIMFSLASSAALTSMMLGYLIYPTLFTSAHQFTGWSEKGRIS